MRGICVGLLIVTVLLLNPREALARRIVIWTYEDLLKEADLVVVAKAVATEATDDRYESTFSFEFAGQDTQFEVLAALKGEVGKKLTVLHFKRGKLKPNGSEEQAARNSPHFVTFRNLELQVDIYDTRIWVPAPDYLLFLKKRKDGRYEPVSGQVDPDQSARELFTDLLKKLDSAHEQRPKR